MTVSEPAALDSLVANVLDEYRERLKRGERPSIEEYAERHPEAADLLRNILATIELLELSISGGANISGDSPNGTLGDFRLIREIGRGGMGIVYEAEQISLNRNVALKVLPFAATMDPRHLQRFRNEAQAAACLHHANIVPVHGVGCDRGVHYYAMQLIEGQTLAEVIQNLTPRPPSRSGKGVEKVQNGVETILLPSPPASGGEGPGVRGVRSTAANALLSTKRDRAHFRHIATLIASAADALEYAHSMGVVHRDIKPGNLMLDNGGHLWITDFGLAKLANPAREGGGELTMTGDLIGTLRYMSPEQALAKHGLVDHRTDIYSLGATLYELLTLKPAVAGEDKAEILKAIAWDEPTPLRKHDKSIPAELETITLKCLAKEPRERYATAGEAAEDLRRWIADRAIKAKATTCWQRTVKWSRRHPSATLMIIAASITIVAGICIWQLQNAAAERAATAVNSEARALQSAERFPEALAVAKRAADLLPHFGGDGSLKQAIIETVADLGFICRVEVIRMDGAVGIRGENFDPQQDAPAYQAAFLEYGVDVERERDSEVLAKLQRRAIRSELAGALESWSLHVDSTTKQRLTRLVDALEPDGLVSRIRNAGLARNLESLKTLAIEAAESGTPACIVPLAAYLDRNNAKTECEKLLRAGVQRFPSDFWLNHCLGLLLDGDGIEGANRRLATPEQTAEALVYLRAALVVRPHSAGAWRNVSNVLTDLERYDEAIVAAKRAVELSPHSMAYTGLAISLAKSGRRQEASDACRLALELNRQNPTANYEMGIILWCLGQPDEAIPYLRRAIEIFPRFHAAHNNLGKLLLERGKFDDACEAWRRAIQIDPGAYEPYFKLGDALARSNQPTTAIPLLKKAIQLKSDDVESHLSLGIALTGDRRFDEAVTTIEHATHLAPKSDRAFQCLGTTLSQMGRYEDAANAFRKVCDLNPQEPNCRYDLGNMLVSLGRSEEAIEAYARAIALNPDYAEAHCNLGLAHRALGRFRDAIDSIRRGHELGRRQPNWQYPSAEWLQQSERLAALDDMLPKILSGQARPTDAMDLVELGRLCGQYKKNHAAAARFFAQAFAANSTLVEDLGQLYRYSAASSAAQAGCGNGSDAAQLSEAERSQFRQQAFDWLTADLVAWEKLASQPHSQIRAREILEHWRIHADLAGVRGDEALAKLPEAEREPWRKLWSNANAILERVKEAKKP